MGSAACMAGHSGCVSSEVASLGGKEVEEDMLAAARATERSFIIFDGAMS